MEIEKDSADIIDIGSILRIARKEKGLEIADIAHSLKIRQIYIDSIERNNYENLPETTYIMGYVRSYANYLSLSNIEELVLAAKMNSHISKGIPLPNSNIGVDKNNHSNKTKKSESKTDIVKKNRSIKNIKLYIGIAVSVFVVFIIIQAIDNDDPTFTSVSEQDFINTNKSNAVIDNSSPISNLAVASSSTTQQNSEVVETATPRREPWPTTGSDSKASIYAINNVKITITDKSGLKVYYNNDLVAGYNFTLPVVNDDMVLAVSNAKDIIITLNDVSYEYDRDRAIRGLEFNSAYLRRILKEVSR